jgi:GT2 family glycosyltransferase
MPDGTAASNQPKMLRIFVVIVLYKQTPEESLAFQSLQKAMEHFNPAAIQVKILLFDNTPGSREVPGLTGDVVYVAAGSNEGLSGAYNHALTIASSEGFTWLLTLDQDTTLPEYFLAKMNNLTIAFAADETIGAIVPQLSDKGILLSPAEIRFWGTNNLPKGFVGILLGEVHAFNSASLFRVSALLQIGGFSRHFWLDFADAWTYKQLFLSGKKVYVAGDIDVTHELSLLDTKKKVGPERFANILGAESAFVDIYEGHIRGLMLTGRLLGRMYRQFKRHDDALIRSLTRESFKRRALHSRKRRIHEWTAQMEARQTSSENIVSGMSFVGRTSISVCMAAYNGERHISAQITSILHQLANYDELIVVDDCSNDGTREIVRGMNDRRIRLLEHEKNLGVSHSFEDAIRAARNGILFLSDQDDLWAANKVDTILAAFAANPQVTLIATDAALIDADGALISASYFAGRGTFHSGFWQNFLRNRFGGCTMAFRSSILPDILPLPHDYDVLHDLWIGVRNSLSQHRTLYIDSPLVLNRRHASTTTGRGQLGLWEKIRNRIHLLMAVARFGRPTGSQSLPETEPRKRP